MKADKILSIQYLRGLAALGVVFCHFGFALTDYHTLQSIFNTGQLGVEVFFMISGFVIVYSLEKIRYSPSQFFIFLAKRSIRIDPPYWLMIILYIALGLFLNQLASYKGVIFKFDNLQFLSQLFYFTPFTSYDFYNNVFWTLAVEFQFYVIIGLFYFLSSSKTYKAAFLILFALTAFLPIHNDRLIFHYAPAFAFGIAFYNFWKKNTIVRSILPIIFIALSGHILGLTTAVFLCFAAIVVQCVKYEITPLSFLGNISYSLYLTHPFVLEILTGIFKRIPGRLLDHQLLSFVIELTVAILFGWLFYLLIEKRSIRLSKKFIYQRTNRLSVKDSSMQIR